MEIYSRSRLTVQTSYPREGNFIQSLGSCIKVFAIGNFLIPHELCNPFFSTNWFYNCFRQFLQVKYVSGSYDNEEGFRLLDKEISEHEISKNSREGSSRRLFYLALPPSVYPLVSKMIRNCCMNRCKPHLTT